MMLTASYAIFFWTGALAFGAPNAPLVQATDAWIRLLPAGLPAAGYVTLHNTSDKPVALLGVQSPDYGSAMLHQSRDAGGVSQMVAVDKIIVPARSTVAFGTGGFHIMLMQAKRPLRPGNVVPIKLDLDGGDSLTVNFEVRNASGGAADAAGGTGTSRAQH